MGRAAGQRDPREGPVAPAGLARGAGHRADARRRIAAAGAGTQLAWPGAQPGDPVQGAGPADLPPVDLSPGPDHAQPA
ncbi:hypothetical protein G6F46_015121 [Rhizopus delemar]|nr:hypothetical protein G6F46_015121 [Rhizopus delemar]